MMSHAVHHVQGINTIVKTIAYVNMIRSLASGCANPDGDFAHSEDNAYKIDMLVVNYVQKVVNIVLLATLV